MPLKLTDTSQVASLNKWADSIDQELSRLNSAIRQNLNLTSKHQAIFERFFNNPQDLQQALAKAGINVAANTSHASTGTVSSTGGSPTFTWTAGANSISWTWNSSSVIWGDGTTHTVPSSTAVFGGPYTVTGLAAATDYYFYPYWDYQRNQFTWVSSCNCAGTPCTAYTLANATYVISAIQSANGHLALSNGGIKGTTGGGGGSDTGGGRAGDNGCHPPYLRVETKTGIKSIVEVEVGDCLASPEGWTTVRSKQVVPQEEFIRVVLNSGEVYETVPRHEVITPGSTKLAESLTLSDALFTRAGVSFVRSIERFQIVDGVKVVLTCSPHAEFYAGLRAPTILAHNTGARNLS